MGEWFKYLFKGYERFRWYYRLCWEIDSLICFDIKCPQRLLFTFKSIRSVLAATKHLNWCYLKIVISCRLLLAKRKTKKKNSFLYLFHILYFVHILKWWEPWKLFQDYRKKVWLLLALEAYSLWISQKRMASQVPNHIALIANNVCIYKSHKTIAQQKKQFLSGCRSTLFQPWLYTWVRPKGSMPKCPSSSFSLEEFNCILPQLLLEGLDSMQPASRCWLPSSPLGHCWVSAYP